MRPAWTRYSHARRTTSPTCSAATASSCSPTAPWSGPSRSLPLLGYVRGAPERAFFVGNPLERGQQEHEPLGVPDVSLASWTSRESGRPPARALAARGVARVAIEPSFLPHDAHQELAGAELIDGSG